MTPLKMKTKNNAKHGNDHKLKTPKTTEDKGNKDDSKFTSYDTTQQETSTPQKVRQTIEPEGEQKRMKEAKS